MNAKDWQAASVFCRKLIKEVYDIDYNPDWHQDLDAMGKKENVYDTPMRGAFVLVIGDNGAVIACGGLRDLATRPQLAASLSDRYPDPHAVGGLWRAYVETEYRGQGLGTVIKVLRIAAARQLNYETLYLHASRKNPVAIHFGKTHGFTLFQEDNDEARTVHMDRAL